MTRGVPKTEGRRGAGARVVTTSLVAALLATWGGAGSSTASSSSSVSPEVVSHLSARLVSTRVRVSEREFSITLDRVRFRPGKHTFVIQNGGGDPHNLLISGPGVSSRASQLLAAGRSGSLTVTLRRGYYRLWCSVPGHDSAGMHTTIRVR